MKLKSDRFLWISLFIAFIWYGAISFVNHYCYRTYALDLGVYTNALYDYAHFQWNDSLAFKSVPENLMADHFDWYLPIFSPFIYVFGSYTLLVIQIVAILFGAIGIYRLINLWFPDKPFMARIGLIYFLSFFGVLGAVAFDYHSNVVAAMLIPWLFLRLEQRKLKSVLIFFFLIIIAKENMALWLLFIALGLSWKYRKDQLLRRVNLYLSIFSVLYFVAVVGLWMPAFSTSGTFDNFKYSLLGNTAGEALKFILMHPFTSFKYLFINTSGDQLYENVKLEMWIFLLLNAFLLIRKPYFLLMILPIIGQKMFNDNPTMWGVTHHYSIEFAPIITLGIFEFLRDVKKLKTQRIIGYTMLIIGIGTGIHVMDNTVAYAEKARIRIYKQAHYSREFSISEANLVIKKIPENAIVSAQSAFVPHLALRDYIYTFPSIKNAEYVLFSPVENTFPIEPTDFVKLTDSLVRSSSWEKLYHSPDFILLKRNK